jgi:cell division protein FtsQ
MTIVLGTNDILTRLRRFVHAYEKQLHMRQKDLAYVDLRYTSGMAIGWKPS